MWTAEVVLEGVFALLESPLFDEAKTLLTPLLTQQPLLLLLLLLASSTASYMKRFVAEQLLLQVACDALPQTAVPYLKSAIASNRRMVVATLELFLMSHETIPSTLLVNVNQLELQGDLLLSPHHLVFNQLFVKNWSLHARDTQRLEAVLRARVAARGQVVLTSMVAFVTAHAPEFEKSSAALFALLHVWTAAVSNWDLGYLILMLQYLVPGLVFAWAYEHSGTLWTSILLHAIVNALSLFTIAS